MTRPTLFDPEMGRHDSHALRRPKDNRPGGFAPDKRTRPTPATATTPPRSGGPLLL